MHQIWKRLLTKASDLLPDFNDNLLLKFRERKIKQIRNYLDDLFKQMQNIKMFEGKFRYVGYQELSPDEQMEYIRTNQIMRKRMEIQKSTFELIRYNFEFEGKIYPIHIYIPYMEHGAIWLSDTKYYPLLPVVERGGLHRTPNSIIIKVMRAPLTFKRSTVFSFTTTSNKSFREHIITVKIHQRKRSKGKKSTDRTPLILYHLVKEPFNKVMQAYGFGPGEIDIVDNCNPVENFDFIKIKENIWLKVKSSTLNNSMLRKVIASYLYCLTEYTRFDLRDLLSPDQVYYKTVLGKYTYPNNSNALLLFDNARKHLETTDTLLDLPAQYQLSQIGINVNNIYELLYVVFFNMDKWCTDYNPIDLYEKKIGSLEQTMAGLVTIIHNKLFQLINNKKEGITAETIKKFTTSASQNTSWLSGNTAFRANPSICNDNRLLAIDAKRFRTLENTETKVAQSSGRNMPMYLLKSHPSQLVVESVLSLPPSAQLGPLVA